MQGWRKGQEDAHIAADVGGTAVFGVFDGHGGREVSNFTAKRRRRHEPAGRVNGNLNLSRSLGDLKYKGNKALGRDRQMITAEPDVAVHTLVARDDEFMVLACDGVWDVLSNQECVDFVRERIATTPPAVIAEQIFDRCIADDPKTTQGIGGDNMTAVIVKFNWAS
ncbi:protein serine/threonine phosphatase [Aureococcus anophagefferens]|nr:protein serine/threonine phosphatase [Aureococcus anophagefferens]